MFAAWPYLYAASFSGFYFAILLVLVALIVRPVSLNSETRGTMRDGGTCGMAASPSPASSCAPLGVAIGISFGVPLRYDDTMRITYDGGSIGLLRPFALLAGSNR